MRSDEVSECLKGTWSDVAASGAGRAAHGPKRAARISRVPGLRYGGTEEEDVAEGEGVVVGWDAGLAEG